MLVLLDHLPAFIQIFSFFVWNQGSIEVSCYSYQDYQVLLSYVFFKKSTMANFLRCKCQTCKETVWSLLFSRVTVCDKCNKETPPPPKSNGNTKKDAGTSVDQANEKETHLEAQPVNHTANSCNDVIKTDGNGGTQSDTTDDCPDMNEGQKEKKTENSYAESRIQHEKKMEEMRRTLELEREATKKELISKFEERKKNIIADQLDKMMQEEHKRHDQQIETMHIEAQEELALFEKKVQLMNEEVDKLKEEMITTIPDSESVILDDGAGATLKVTGPGSHYVLRKAFPTAF